MTVFMGFGCLQQVEDVPSYMYPAEDIKTCLATHDGCRSLLQ